MTSRNTLIDMINLKNKEIEKLKDEVADLNKGYKEDYNRTEDVIIVLEDEITKLRALGSELRYKLTIAEGVMLDINGWDAYIAQSTKENNNE